MKRKIFSAPGMLGLVFTLLPGLASAERLRPQTPWPSHAPAIDIRMTCKMVSSCAEAVELWCGGYYGADRDHDGIPCETVCSTREEVQAIEAEIGCDL